MVKQKLNLTSAVFIVMGSMIGSGIFIVSADMARVLQSPFLLLLTWVITGAMTLMAALCYGELASMFPRSGGQYQYLKEAYNEFTAFLYGWALFAVIQCGTIAAVAVAFAKFAGVLLPMFSVQHILLNLGFLQINAAQVLAIFSLVVLTFINTLGLKTGAIVQNTLTIIKALSFLFLIVLGLSTYRDAEVVGINFGNFFSYNGNAGPIGLWAIGSAIGVAMVGSLFSSDAWNNVTFIAGEVHKPKKTIPGALVLGVTSVTIIYLLSNLSYLAVLPFWGTPDGAGLMAKGIQYADQDRVGTAAMTAMLGPLGATLMAITIMISTFGCNNGLILSGARVYHTMAKDGLFFQKMKQLNTREVPAFALWVQCIWCSVLCLSGRYGDLLDYVMFIVVIFYILTVAGVIVLRLKRPKAHRPYKTFLYPILPVLYIILAALFTVNVLYTKPQYTLPGLVILGLGIPVYYFWKRRQPEMVPVPADDEQV